MSNYKNIFKDFAQKNQSQEQKERLSESIEFRKNFDKLFLEKYPKVNFALHTTSDSVKAAYNRMINGSNSDFTIGN